MELSCRSWVLSPYPSKMYLFVVVADPANSAKLTSTKPSYRKDKKNAHYQWFCYLCVLPPWHIKIPKMQIICGMGLVGCKDQFIDRSEDVFFIEYPVGVISVAVLVAVVKWPLFLLVFVVLYNRRSIFLFH